MAGAPDVVDNVQDLVALLEIDANAVVLEIGWDEDADSSISEAIESHIGESLLEEDTDELCDVVLMWWRDDDGDLVDGLVDAIRPLAEAGKIWLLSPAIGKPGALGVGVVPESAQLAGLVQTKSERLGDWQAACLVQSGITRG